MPRCEIDHHGVLRYFVCIFFKGLTLVYETLASHKIRDNRPRRLLIFESAILKGYSVMQLKKL